MRASFAGAKHGPATLLSLGAERGPGSSVRLQRQDMRSFFGSAVDLERSESQKWVRVRRGHIFYYIFFPFFLSVLVPLFVAWQPHELLTGIYE